MELDISRLFSTLDPRTCGASQAELGPDAGPITWRNAQAAALDYPDLIPDADAAATVRAYFAEFGAWDDAELQAMSTHDLTALLIQFITGDIREARLSPISGTVDWLNYQRRAEEGTCSGNLYRSIGPDGVWQVGYYVGG